MINLYQINEFTKILKEYNTSNTLSTISGKGGKKASGKSFDRIAVGASKPYQDNVYHTKYENDYPELGKLVQRLKSSSLKGNIAIVGQAYNELRKLLKSFKTKKDLEGSAVIGRDILPFGDNVRLMQNKGAYYVSYIEPDKKENIDPLTNNKNNLDLPNV